MQELAKTPTVARLSEEDFVQACKSPRSGPASEAEKLELRELVVGQPVREQKLTAAQLQAGGYQSWREYLACAYMRAY